MAFDDVFVTRLNAAGSAVMYSLVIGGGGLLATLGRGGVPEEANGVGRRGRLAEADHARIHHRQQFIEHPAQGVRYRQ